MTSLYRRGLAAPAMILPERAGTIVAGTSMMWRGTSRDHSAKDLYHIGTGKLVIGKSTSDSVTDTLVDLMLKLAHILLIAVGLFTLISAI